MVRARSYWAWAPARSPTCHSMLPRLLAIWPWWAVGGRGCLGDDAARSCSKTRDDPGPSRSVGVGLGDGEGDAVDVLVQPAGVGAGVGAEGAVGLLGAALQDVEAVIEALARVGAGHDVAVVGPSRVADQAAAGESGQVEPVVVPIEGEVAVAEHLVLGLVALARDAHR